MLNKTRKAQLSKNKYSLLFYIERTNKDLFLTIERSESNSVSKDPSLTKTIEGCLQEFLAIEDLDGFFKNISCVDCIDCANCDHCEYCTDCKSCKNCRYCTDCEYCKACKGCKNCECCTNCINCKYYSYAYNRRS